MCGGASSENTSHWDLKVRRKQNGICQSVVFYPHKLHGFFFSMPTFVDNPLLCEAFHFLWALQYFISLFWNLAEKAQADRGRTQHSDINFESGLLPEKSVDLLLVLLNGIKLGGHIQTHTPLFLNTASTRHQMHTSLSCSTFPVHSLWQ